jgi:serine/threonine protein kinase
MISNNLLGDNGHYLKQGDIINLRYGILERLGEGSFGETYKAEDLQKFKAIVVVKRLKTEEYSGDTLKKATELFEREGQTLQNLQQYSQIPRLEAYFIENSNCYLVMEYIEGLTLAQEELKDGNQLKEKNVSELLTSILKILQVVHGKGLVHRDLKPDNVIRRVNNSITLIDFGSVTKDLNLSHSPTRPDITTIGSMYAAPEQLFQGKAFPSSDIYAVGMIAIQALTGRSPINLSRDLQTQDILWEYLVPTTSESFKKIIQKMTKYEPAQRYQSVDEVLKDLDEPGPPPPPPEPEPIEPIPSIQPEPIEPIPSIQPQPATLQEIQNSATSISQDDTIYIKNSTILRIVCGLGFVALLSISIFWLFPLLFGTRVDEVNPNLFPKPNPREVVSGTEIRIAGSITTVALNKKHKEDFEKEFPATIDLTAYNDELKKGSNNGIKVLCQGKVDIAAISRSLDKDEKCDDGGKLFAVKIGIDDLSVIVHYNNPVDNLTKSQVKQIFQCQISQWTDIYPTWTNKNPEIQVINPPPQAGTYDYFKDKILDNEAFCPQDSPNFEQKRKDEKTETIKNFKINQISYGGYDVMDDSRVKRLSIDNVKLGEENYPYRRPLYYVYKADSAENPSRRVKQFLGFVLNSTK